MTSQFATRSFEVTYTTRGLGLDLDGTGEFPVVTGCRGASHAAGVITGDLICAINTVDVRGMGWEQMLETITAVPATVVFVRCEMKDTLATAATRAAKAKANPVGHRPNTGKLEPVNPTTYDKVYIDARLHMWSQGSYIYKHTLSHSNVSLPLSNHLSPSL